MLTGALLDLMDEESRLAFVDEFNSLGIPGVVMEIEPSVKCGVSGTHVHINVNGVEEGEHMHDDHDHHHDHYHGHEGHHPHNGMHEIEHIVNDHIAVPDNVREDILKVYGIIADAESKAHGVPVTDIHFHEVGTMDAVADVTAVCMLMDRIGPQKIIASPVNVGGGTVKCAHGILPVPAPATANILVGLPYYSGDIKSELCTPTGAALLRYFADEFSDIPEAGAEPCGYGMGTRDFERPNCVRISVSEV
jgi:uncharacterized protein (DUF111 family)